MGKIKNPTEIVEPFVSDYRRVFGDQLLSIIMYGSAVTHEYKPGISDINISIIIRDNSITEVAKSIPLQNKWAKKSVVTPFFLTPEYIHSSCDTYPIEYLDMRSNYRVLFGEDFLERLEIKREHIRLQCERELRGVAIHIRRSFVQSGGNTKQLSELLSGSIRRLMPIFKALLVLKDRPIPKTKSDIIAMVEDDYSLGVSSLSLIYNTLAKKGKQDYSSLFDAYARDIDKLIVIVDSLNQ